MPEIGRFFGVDPVSSEYMSISTFQFAHNNPIWKIEIEGLEGKSVNKSDAISHDPVKVVTNSSKGPATSFVGFKLVETTTKKVATEAVKNEVKKEVVKQIAKRTILARLAMFSRFLGPGLIIKKFDAPSPEMMEKAFEPKIDEKLKVDNIELKPETDNDSPIRRVKTTGKNGKHANANAKESALDKYNNFKKEFDSLKSKPNKTKDDKKAMEKARKQMVHWKGKADFSGENHNQRKKGN